MHPHGLYLHIPWCPTRCTYCDFNTYIDSSVSLRDSYQQSLLQEIEQAGVETLRILETVGVSTRPPLRSIFFGGGTPTTLSPEKFYTLINTVQTSFTVAPTTEITTEANPATLSLAYLRELRQSGVNRLSVGVQSFHDDELTFLSRRHSAADVPRVVDWARQAGFDNLSLDLIFNLPHQSVAQWQQTLEQAITLKPDHLSIYSLIVEPGTPLQRQIEQGLHPHPDQDLAAEMYALTLAQLAEAGYVHYEVSNWAQGPDFASQHNLIYWRNQPYLGFGAGAFSTLSGQRWANVKRPQDYIKRATTQPGLAPAQDSRTVEQVTTEMAMIEQILLGLRLVQEGISDQAFAERFGISLREQYAEPIQQAGEQGWLEWVSRDDQDWLRLTPSGLFIANQVILMFM